MASEIMHPRIYELTRELIPLAGNPPAKPTEEDRRKLMTVRDQIKYLCEDPCIALSNADERARELIYMIATKEANRQEEFYESNGNKWAT